MRSLLLVLLFSSILAIAIHLEPDIQPTRPGWTTKKKETDQSTTTKRTEIWTPSNSTTVDLSATTLDNLIESSMFTTSEGKSTISEKIKSGSSQTMSSGSSKLTTLPNLKTSSDEDKYTALRVSSSAISSGTSTMTSLLNPETSTNGETSKALRVSSSTIFSGTSTMTSLLNPETSTNGETSEALRVSSSTIFSGTSTMTSLLNPETSTNGETSEALRVSSSTIFSGTSTMTSLLNPETSTNGETSEALRVSSSTISSGTSTMTSLLNPETSTNGETSKALRVSSSTISSGTSTMTSLLNPETSTNGETSEALRVSSSTIFSGTSTMTSLLNPETSTNGETSEALRVSSSTISSGTSTMTSLLNPETSTNGETLPEEGIVTVGHVTILICPEDDTTTLKSTTLPSGNEKTSASKSTERNTEESSILPSDETKTTTLNEKADDSTAIGSTSPIPASSMIPRTSTSISEATPTTSKSDTSTSMREELTSTKANVVAQTSSSVSSTSQSSSTSAKSAKTQSETSSSFEITTPTSSSIADIQSTVLSDTTISPVLTTQSTSVAATSGKTKSTTSMSHAPSDTGTTTLLTEKMISATINVVAATGSSVSPKSDSHSKGALSATRTSTLHSTASSPASKISTVSTSNPNLTPSVASSSLITTTKTETLPSSISTSPSPISSVASGSTFDSTSTTSLKMLTISDKSPSEKSDSTHSSVSVSTKTQPSTFSLKVSNGTTTSEPTTTTSGSTLESTSTTSGSSSTLETETRTSTVPESSSTAKIDWTSSSVSENQQTSPSKILDEITTTKLSNSEGSGHISIKTSAQEKTTTSRYVTDSKVLSREMSSAKAVSTSPSSSSHSLPVETETKTTPGPTSQPSSTPTKKRTQSLPTSTAPAKSSDGQPEESTSSKRKTTTYDGSSATLLETTRPTNPTKENQTEKVVTKTTENGRKVTTGSPNNQATPLTTSSASHSQTEKVATTVAVKTTPGQLGQKDSTYTTAKVPQTSAKSISTTPNIIPVSSTTSDMEDATIHLSTGTADKTAYPTSSIFTMNPPTSEAVEKSTTNELASTKKIDNEPSTSNEVTETASHTTYSNVSDALLATNPPQSISPSPTTASATNLDKRTSQTSRSDTVTTTKAPSSVTSPKSVSLPGGSSSSTTTASRSSSLSITSHSKPSSTASPKSSLSPSQKTSTPSKEETLSTAASQKPSSTSSKTSHQKTTPASTSSSSSVKKSSSIPTTENPLCSQQCPTGYLIGTSYCFKLAPASTRINSYQSALSHCKTVERQTLASLDKIKDTADIKMIQESAGLLNIDWVYSNGIGGKKERFEKMADVYSVFAQTLVSSPILMTVGISERFENISALCVLPKYCNPNECDVEKLFLAYDYYSRFKESAGLLLPRKSGTVSCLYGNQKTETVTCNNLGAIYPNPSNIDCEESATERAIRDTTNETVSSCKVCFGRGTKECQAVIDSSGNVEGYRCVCKEPYMMARCWKTKNMCNSTVCGKNGVCLSEIGVMSCNCKWGYTGDRCEKELKKLYNGDIGYSSTVGATITLGGWILKALKLLILGLSMNTDQGEDPQDTHQSLRSYCMTGAGIILTLWSNPTVLGIDQAACRFYFIGIHFCYLMAMIQWVLEGFNVNQVLRVVQLNEWEVDRRGDRSWGVRIIPRLAYPAVFLAVYLLVTFQTGWNQLAADWTCVGVICQQTLSVWIPIFALVLFLTLLAAGIYELSFLIKSRRPLLAYQLDLVVEREMGPNLGRRVQKCRDNELMCFIGLLLLIAQWLSVIVSSDYRDDAIYGWITVVCAGLYSAFCSYQEIVTSPEDYAQLIELLQRWAPARFAPDYNPMTMWTIDEVKKLYKLPKAEREAAYEGFLTMNQKLLLHHKWDIRLNEILAKNPKTEIHGHNGAIYMIYLDEIREVAEKGGTYAQIAGIKEAYAAYCLSVPHRNPREAGIVNGRLELVTLAADHPQDGIKLAKFFIVPGFHTFEPEIPERGESKERRRQRKHEKQLMRNLKQNIYEMGREEAIAQNRFLNSSILFFNYGNKVVR